MTDSDRLHKEWSRQLEATNAPPLDELRRRRAHRVSRRTTAGAVAGVLVVAGAGLGLGAALTHNPEPPTVVAGQDGATQRPSEFARTSVPNPTPPQSETTATKGSDMPSPSDDTPEATPQATVTNPEVAEKLRDLQNKRNIPFPETLPKTPPKVSSETTASLVANSDTVFTFSPRGSTVMESTPVQLSPGVVEDIKGAVGASSFTLPQGNSGWLGTTDRVLAFASSGTIVALYEVNGEVAKQVEPQHTLLPGIVSLAEVRAAAR